MLSVTDPAALVEAVRGAGPRGVIARGLGRSYGDAAGNAGGLVLDLTGLDRIHRIDADAGLATVDAGISLDALMRAALPLRLWTFRRCVQTISASGHVSCLNVLKRFGVGNDAPLSFPTPGWTLAVDLPIGAGLGRLCDELDELVAGAGGRVYLAKDSRLRPESLRRMYPRLDEWRAIRVAVDPHGVFSSDLAKRLLL